MMPSKRCVIVPFSPHMSRSEVIKLQKNDMIDHPDVSGKMRPATIMFENNMIDDERRFLIHYHDDPKKNDVFISANDIHRIAEYKSISSRVPHRLKTLKIGDWVCATPWDDDHIKSKWKLVQIKSFDKYSGQIEVC